MPLALLSDDTGLQEILCGQPEAPNRKLTRLQAEVYVAPVLVRRDAYGGA